MLKLYYYLVLFNALVSLAAAGFAYWKNRFRAVGPLFGITMLINGMWCICFAHYYLPLPDDQALLWAKLTLSMAIVFPPFLFHSMCALVDKADRYRWALGISYASSVVFLVLLWAGHVVDGLKPTMYMEHYIRYNRALYPYLSSHIGLWQFVGVVILILTARKASSYKRTQLIYFITAWFVVFLTVNSIIMPLEYDVNFQQLGFLVLPFNLGFLAYVLSKGRFMEINLAIGKALVYATTMFIVLLLAWSAAEIANRLSPGFLGGPQVVFMLFLMLLISVSLAVVLPRLGPLAEQALQSRMLGDRYRYQQALAELTSQIATISSADELLQTIVDRIVEHMKVQRAMVLMQEDVSTDFVPRARASLQPSAADGVLLADTTEVIQWLRRNKRTLVKDEVQLREPRPRVARIAEELDRVGAALCVPMILDGQLVGTLALDHKTSGDLFIDRDIKLLERLCGEAALAVRYRKFEQQMFQTSKLASLGTLAAGIAHEIRNPLSSIKTFVQLLPSRPNDPEFQAEFSKLVSNDVDRITKIVENVLSFARSSTITLSEQRIEEVLDDSLALIQSKLKAKKVEVIKHYGQVPLARGDKDQLSQVFVNILLNAVEAVPGQGGRIEITCSTAMLESPLEGRRRKTPHITVEIADNGPGIPENIKGRLFDPFFTTKPQGTGLGLAITYKIVEVHGGFISVVSTEGQGATFQVNLPL